MKKVGKKNKGFSLVELIVVVLIIGVIGIALAPQVMKWVDTSKLNTDVNNAEGLQSSVQAALADWQNDGGKLKDQAEKVVYCTAVESNKVVLKVKVGGENKALETAPDFKRTGATENEYLSDYISAVTGDDYPRSKYDTAGFTIEVTNAGKVTVTCTAQTVTP